MTLSTVDPETLSLLSSESRDGIKNRVVQGYFSWRDGALLFSPSLATCPYLLLPHGTRVEPNQTYKCPYPFGEEIMWGGAVELENDIAMRQLLDNLGLSQFYLAD